MSHTNGYIPKTYYEGCRDPELELVKLKAELAFITSKLNSLQRELENIPEAIKEYGRIELTNSNTGEKIELVSREKEQEAVKKSLQRKDYASLLEALVLVCHKELISKKPTPTSKKLIKLIEKQAEGFGEDSQHLIHEFKID